jgi:uracil-DNA glycosylase
MPARKQTQRKRRQGHAAAPNLDRLLAEVRACQLCAKHLPLGPRPILRATTGARLLIVGQAPGTRVHATGIPWNDASGERLRAWMGIGRDTFYDESRIAIIPIGMCYPGRAKNGGDNPPRPECAPTWHPRLRLALPNVELTLLVGSYAQAFYLKNRAGPTMTETVRAWQTYLPEFLPTPHPSWRTTFWLRQNPWFEAELIPALQEHIRQIAC